MSPQNKMYTEEEVEALIVRRNQEQSRDERTNVIEKGFNELKAQVQKANNLKQDIVEQMAKDRQEVLHRLDMQDIKIKEIPELVQTILHLRWTQSTRWLIGVITFLIPIIMLIVNHYWTR